MFSGDFTPLLAKHTKSFNLIDTLSVGVDRIHRNFAPMQHQVETWRQTQITDTQARLIIYAAFVDGKLDAPRSLLPEVHRLYFEPLRLAMRNGLNAVCIVTRSLPPACRASRSF
jgi:hypothetical protein